MKKIIIIIVVISLFLNIFFFLQLSKDTKDILTEDFDFSEDIENST
jgi:hypothetical protein